jgi:hypothetical protein
MYTCVLAPQSGPATNTRDLRDGAQALIFLYTFMFK